MDINTFTYVYLFINNFENKHTCICFFKLLCIFSFYQQHKYSKLFNLIIAENIYSYKLKNTYSSIVVMVITARCFIERNNQRFETKIKVMNTVIR